MTKNFEKLQDFLGDVFKRTDRRHMKVRYMRIGQFQIHFSHHIIRQMVQTVRVEVMILVNEIVFLK